MAKKFTFAFLVILLLFAEQYSRAQTIKLCFNNSSLSADLVLRFTDFLPAADICVWTGRTTMADVDICFVKNPSSSSIDISIVDSPGLADYTICMNGTPFSADKTIAITSSLTAADVCVGIWSYPTSFTKDIYIKGIDAEKLPLEKKVAILYCLGLLRKR